MGHDTVLVQALFAIPIGLTILSATIEIHNTADRRITCSRSFLRHDDVFPWAQFMCEITLGKDLSVFKLCFGRSTTTKERRTNAKTKTLVWEVSEQCLSARGALLLADALFAKHSHVQQPQTFEQLFVHPSGATLGKYIISAMLHQQ